jgi:sensor c-di-GMP phosphodiesterase-like protein
MVYYLENSQYMQERTRSEKRKLQAFKARIEQELAQMDTVKSSLQGMLRRGGNTAGGFITEPGNVNSEIVTIYEQLLETDQALEFVDNIQVISSFDQVENPSSPKLYVCLAAGLVLGIFAAMLIIFLRQL